MRRAFLTLWPSPPLPQDELFNLTTDEIRTTAIRSQLDMHVSGQGGNMATAAAWHSSNRVHSLLLCPTTNSTSCFFLPNAPNSQASGIHRLTARTWSQPPPVHPQVEGSIQKVQLDNQMLDAVQPVVLAPAVEYKPSGEEGGGGVVGVA